MLSLVLFLAVTAGAAAFGARFRPGAWYERLEKPPWNPPAKVFAPVWSVLYVAIAIAGWRIWKAEPGWSPPLVLWGIQLVFNALWSWLFFGRRKPLAALVDIGLLCAAIVAFIALAWPVDRLAAGLFVVYGLWVGFASSLNGEILRRNAGASA